MVPELVTFVADLPQADRDYEHFLLEVLWTYQSLGVVEPKLLDRLLEAHDGRARAAAVRVLAAWQARLPGPLERLAELASDDFPRVRLEAARALALLGSLEAAQAAMRVLDKPMDRFLDHALQLTMRELQSVWLPALERGGLDFAADGRKLAFALSAVDSVEAIGPLAKLITAGKLPADRRAGALVLLATIGGAKELTLVLDEAMAAGTSPPPQTQLLEALIRAGRERKLKPLGEPDRIGSLLRSPAAAVRLAAIELVGIWQLESRLAELDKLATSEKSPSAERAAALGRWPPWARPPPRPGLWPWQPGQIRSSDAARRSVPWRRSIRPKRPTWQWPCLGQSPTRSTWPDSCRRFWPAKEAPRP